MLKMLHSGWAYIALIVLVVAVVNAAIGFFSKKNFFSFFIPESDFNLETVELISI